MSTTPTKESIIGNFINGRNAHDDFLQLATNHGGTVFGWIDADGYLQGTLANSGVNSFNGLTGAITLAAGANITLTPSGNTLTISSTSAFGGSIAATEVAFGSAANTIAGNANFTYVAGTLFVTNTDDLSVNTAFNAAEFTVSSTNAGTVTINDTIFPDTMPAAVFISSADGAGDLLGTNNGPVGALFEANLTTAAHVSALTSAVFDVGTVAGSTVDAATGIWIPSVGDPGGTITLSRALYIAPQTAGAVTAYGLYVDGTQQSFINSNLIISGNTSASTTPLSITTHGTGPANRTNSAIAISNSGGGTTTYFDKSSAGVFRILNDALLTPSAGNITLSPTAGLYMDGGSNSPSLVLLPSTSTVPGVGSGSALVTMFKTGLGNHVFGAVAAAGSGDNGEILLDPFNGWITFYGNTSGNASIGVNVVSGTPSPILLPTGTGAVGQVLEIQSLVYEGSPAVGPYQQTAWVTPSSTFTTGIVITPSGSPALSTINSIAIPVASGAATFTQTIASGSKALGTTLITSGAAAATVTVAATGVLSTDNVMADFNADPTGVTGYAPSANGMLTIIKWCSAGNVNFKVVNNTGASITPGAITLNWRVVR